MQFSAGSVLSRSFGITLKNLIPFVLISLIVYLPLIVIAALAVSSESGTAAAMGLVVAMAFAALFAFFVTAAITYGVYQQLRGNAVAIGEMMSAGFKRMFPVLGVALVAGLLIGIGLLLLAVPGIILLCILFVAVPVAVVEKPGVFGSLSRSAELTKGKRWSIFAIVLVIFVVQVIINQVVKGAGGAPQPVTYEPGTIPTVSISAGIVIVSMLVSMFMNLYQSVCQAVAYFDLRQEKEGVGIDELASVFE